MMNILLLAFILLEFSNVVALYFVPGSKRANAVGVFSAWEKSKQFPEIHDLMRYWFIGCGNKIDLPFSAGADCALPRSKFTAVGVWWRGSCNLTFYWRMFPLARKMDRGVRSSRKITPLILGGRSSR